MNSETELKRGKQMFSVELPNFSFVIPDKLAGSGLLGNRQALSVELKELKKQGIGGIVTLTEWSLHNEHLIAEEGIEYLHIPVRDFGVPSFEQAEKVVSFVDDINSEKGKGVVVHCWAGVGRTGTMLACYLVAKGITPEEAILEIRQKRPRSVETPGQERFVRAWAEYLVNNDEDN